MGLGEKIIGTINLAFIVFVIMYLAAMTELSVLVSNANKNLNGSFLSVFNFKRKNIKQTAA
ncbi:MAG: hypothetical protein BJBARM5_1069 [Candidatus Parvarchaeum acidophilus ARMAN-5]|jgi:hypothetical protein|uniref:Uncharacterized protein n=1 Tax=Candidatus Parvarchaeum acidophilus ARMAN-5 TaxID=662762 RepID=D6GX45_PARA5|nr:MAG: hypothetical protein BJBARM5_1069 [Candidatus Parvarchaeum acidophilus ARMAN-5]